MNIGDSRLYFADQDLVQVTTDHSFVEELVKAGEIDRRPVSYTHLIINISHEALDRVFQYRVPFSLYEQIRVGQSVRVPFGAGNREQKGYVVRLSDRADYDLSLIHI